MPGGGNASIGIGQPVSIQGNYVTQVEALTTGAINVTYGNQANNAIKTKILTLRVAVDNMPPTTNVAWVCGNAGAPNATQSKIQGANATNIENKYLPSSCR